MQAIITQFMPATNTHGTRIKATADRGSIRIPYPDGTIEEAHIKAAEALCLKFIVEDEVHYRTKDPWNPWGRARVCGGLPNGGGYAHVFSGGAK